MKKGRILSYILICLFVMVAAANAAPNEVGVIDYLDYDRMIVNADGSIDVNTVAVVASISEIASGVFKLVDWSGDYLVIDSSGFITANINGAVTVTATDLDIRNLTAASDTVTITGSVSITGGLTTVEYKNYDIPPTSASGANLDPAAASYIVTIKNVHSASVWMKVGATPATKDGLEITAKGSRVIDNVTISDLEFYNPDTATATIAIEYWR